MNIISQNFKDVLKNKIKVIISTNLYKYIDILMDNFSFTLDSNNNYFNIEVKPYEIMTVGIAK